MSQFQTYLLITILSPLFLYFFTREDHWLYWLMAFLMSVGATSQIINKYRKQRRFTIIGSGLIGIGCLVVAVGGDYDTGWIVIFTGIVVCIWRDFICFLWSYRLKDKN